MDTLDLYYKRNISDDFEEMYDESFSKFFTGFGQGFDQGSEFGGKSFDHLEGAAQLLIQKTKGLADYLSKNTGLSLPVTLALVMAGASGGASAMPMIAAMYFSRKYLNLAISKGVGGLVDMSFDLAAGNNKNANIPANQKTPPTTPMAGPTPVTGTPTPMASPSPMASPTQVKTFPQKPVSVDNFAATTGYGKNLTGTTFSNQKLEIEHISFKEWLEIDESWEGAGKFLGRMTGGVYGFFKNLLVALKDRIGEIFQFITKNPREAVKMAAIVGVSMATGGFVGKISHDLVQAVSDKIASVIANVPAEEIHNTVSNMALEKGSGDFSDGSESSGDFDQAQEGPPSPGPVHGFQSGRIDNETGNEPPIDHRHKFIPDSDIDKQRLADEIKNAADRPTGYDRFGRSLADLQDKAETRSLFSAIKRAFGGNNHSLKMSSLPHGTDTSQFGGNLPTTNYYNKSDHMFYGSDGTPEWKFDGKNIIKLK